MRTCAYTSTRAVTYVKASMQRKNIHARTHMHTHAHTYAHVPIQHAVKVGDCVNAGVQCLHTSGRREDIVLGEGSRNVCRLALALFDGDLQAA